MAYYPSSVKNDFTTKVNFSDTILAAHVNDLQGEVTAVETYLGANVEVGSGWIGAFDQITTNWNTLKDRLANIEYGLNIAYNTNTSNLGGTIIQPSTGSTIGLVIKANASQSVDLIEFQTSSGTVVSKVDSSGNIYTSNKQVVPIVYASSQPTGVPAGTIWVDSSSSIATLTAQSGIPSGGTSNQVLAKNSTTDYDVTWVTTHSTPAGGTTGQYLTKVSNTDYDTQWSTLVVPDPTDYVNVGMFFLGGM